MEERPDLVLLDGRIWYTPEGVFALQCVARTTKGRRCKNPVEYGQIAGWPELRSTRGVITAYDLGGLDHAESRRWLGQHCQVHDRPDVVDFEAPGWEPFDPAGAHASMVTPLAEWLQQRTRPLTEGLTDEWVIP